MSRDYAKEKEGKLAYYYCKICSKRVMHSELRVVKGVVYHKECYAKRGEIERVRKARKLQARDDEYIAALRKHKGL